jgi:hypothetical protein
MKIRECNITRGGLFFLPSYPLIKFFTDELVTKRYLGGGKGAFRKIFLEFRISLLSRNDISNPSKDIAMNSKVKGHDYKICEPSGDSFL